jgi:hypothetical protein
VGKGQSAARSRGLRLVAPSRENPRSPAGSLSVEEFLGARSFRSFCLTISSSQASIRLDCRIAGLSCSYEREP